MQSLWGKAECILGRCGGGEYTPMVLFTRNKTPGKNVPLPLSETGTVKVPNVFDVRCEGEILREPRSEIAILTNSSLTRN